MRRLGSGFMLLALCTLFGGCARGPKGGIEWPARPLPDFDLVGRARVRTVRTRELLPAGPAVEGRPGDVVLQNARGRFVVGSIYRNLEGQFGGNLIDAAAQGGRDHTRLLIPLLGSVAARPIYTSLNTENAERLEGPARAVASGHLPGQEGVTVETVYLLRPDESTLEVRTTVRNGTERTLPRFVLGDRLCQGRTWRYVPGVDGEPLGRTTSSRWMAWCVGADSAGLLTEEPQAFEARHRAGCSELRYARPDVAPGATVTYRRKVFVAVGGPDTVWRAAHPFREEEASHLQLCTSGGEGGAVPGTRAVLRPVNGGDSIPVDMRDSGMACVTLPAGTYSVTVHAPGRSPQGPFPAQCRAGAYHRLTLPLPEAARARVESRVSKSGFKVPAPVRVEVYRPGDEEGRQGGPAFPYIAADYLLAGGVGGEELLLPRRDAVGESRCRLVASKGPLWEREARAVRAMRGETAEIMFDMDGRIEAQDYVAVDFRQYTDTSPACNVSPAERALANECDGLDAAIVASPFSELASLSARANEGLLPGLAVECDGRGALTISPVQGGAVSAVPPPGLFEHGQSLRQALRRLRRAFPDALVTLSAPLDPQLGRRALTGRLEPDLDVDAIEFLTGGDVDAAHRLRADWFRMLNSGRRVLAVGASGARGVHRPATARTYVRCSPEARLSDEGIAGAIRNLRRQPDAFVSNGPYIEASVAGAPIGSTVVAEGGRVEMHLRVLAARHVAVDSVVIYRSGKMVREFMPDATQETVRFEGTLVLQAPRDCWFVVEVNGRSAGDEGGRWFAITNPFWVEADADARAEP